MTVNVEFIETDETFDAEFQSDDTLFEPEFDEKMSLMGPPGKSAFEIAVENGFEGTEKEWLSSLKGRDGVTPKKGTDYFTAQEKSEIVNEVISALPVYNGEVEGI